eukprot:TRINITY_DN76155_c0_g1_i1.p1 TRINITY_DN76155_c0_g1~~TRINITY_DN76155_c0_g1_i1.p1  ORF type:complete len:359 (+),score=67.38 TRINITY_DN76155_c0_g1_i1:57-1079(+)
MSLTATSATETLPGPTAESVLVTEARMCSQLDGVQHCSQPSEFIFKRPRSLSSDTDTTVRDTQDEVVSATQDAMISSNPGEPVSKKPRVLCGDAATAAEGLQDEAGYATQDAKAPSEHRSDAASSLQNALVKAQARSDLLLKRAVVAESEKAAALREATRCREEAARAKQMLQDLRDACMCPITHSLLDDPVMASDGHSYERWAMERWLAKSNMSPMTGLRLPSCTLTSNHAVRRVLSVCGLETVAPGMLLETVSRQKDMPKALALLSRGVPDINSKSSDGWTALHHAAMAGWTEVCRAILADVSFTEQQAVTPFGLTAVDLARTWARDDTVAVLELAGM